MGTWGPGVFDNDHARDLFEIEVARIASQLEAVLALKEAAFDDIEGPLVYVHVLALLAHDRPLRSVERERVARWKDQYLHIFDSTTISNDKEYVAQRREVISREFDALLAEAPEAQPMQGPAMPKKKRKGKK